jgi:hypothetical protein
VTKIGGGVSSEKVLSSFEMCGGSSRVGKLLGSGKYTHMINYCELTYCPDCSREGGPIESVRKGRVFNHIDIDQVNIRGIVYTVPLEDRAAFFSRKGLNSLLKMADKVSAKIFGKDSRRTINPHLVGDKSEGFNPHACSMIFESLDLKLKIDLDTLTRLKDEWKKALEGYLRKRVYQVDVHYEFKTTLAQKLHIIRYNVRANFKYDEKTIMMISDDDFKGFRWLRFCGGLRNQGEKDMRDNQVNKKELEKQVGDEIIWLGTVSRKEMLLRFGDMEMERVPGPYEIYVETDKAYKKRKNKVLNFDFKGGYKKK